MARGSKGCYDAVTLLEKGVDIEVESIEECRRSIHQAALTFLDF